jgi:3-phenylpropionate/cinnamic acid dioxygenase small subunit
VTGLERLAAGLAIHDLLHRYARGVDRRDLDLVRSCFAPDARYAGAVAAGTVTDMLAALPAAMARYAATMHFMGEPEVTVEGDAAHALTPALAYHVLRDPPGRLRTVAVRYDDRLERRQETWCIVARHVYRDWERTQ